MLPSSLYSPSSEHSAPPFPVSWLPSFHYFHYSGFLAPYISFWRAPCPPLPVWDPPHFPYCSICSLGELVADSGAGSDRPDLSLDGPRDVSKGRNFPSLLGHVWLWSEWVSNLGHLLTLSCPRICQQRASPSKRPTQLLSPEGLSCFYSHRTIELSSLVPLRQPWRCGTKSHG